MSSQANQNIEQSIEQTTNLPEKLSGILTTDFSFDGFMQNFHFIRPMWLMAFLALFLVLFLLKKLRYYQSPWQHFLPPHLANALLESNNNQPTQGASAQSLFWLKPFIIGTCLIIALAGPAWQKLPQPVYQLDRGAVLIMDMSHSMYATDLKPNRLTRARYKAIDLLNKVNEGDVGLIAYGGDAFIISPLTQDVKNIALLLPSLSPDIMPVNGANALAALTLADKTFKNSGHVSGDIYWFTDDIENEELADIYQWANENNHRINILGVGTKEGAPIKLSSGELLKDNSGAIVIPKLPEERLNAIAQRGRGVYHTMTNGDADIKALTAHLTANLDNDTKDKSADEKESKQAMQGDQYQESGPWLLVIIIPLLLTYFRRGSSILTITWLMPLTFMMSFMGVSPNSYAEEQVNSKSTLSSTASSEDTTSSSSAADTLNSAWKNLWQTPDQQAQQQYQQQNFEQAAQQFENSQWKGTAHYKAGEYEQALAAFQENDSAQSLYNQGNTLAQLQKVDEAIEAYKKALEKDPNLTDAKDNLAQLEALKEQQEQNQQNSDSNQEDQNDQESSEDQQQGDKGEQQQGDSQDQSQEQSQEQSDGEQQPSEDGKEQDAQTTEQNEQDKAAQEAKEAEEKAEAEKLAEAKESDKESPENAEERTLAQQQADNKAQETEQKHQQLLNKVTDDPYLLLRNKMRLEYQKRRQERAPQGENKTW